MTRTLPLFCSLLLLSACLTRRTEAIDPNDQNPSNVSDGGGDSGNDNGSGGGNGSGNGGDASDNNGNGTDGGKPTFCDGDNPCDTPELPYCDEDANACTTCRNGGDCAPFAGRKACVKNEGCFECNGEKAGECGSAKPICDPKKHSCVECTAEMIEGCTLQGKVCDTKAGACVECTASSDCGKAESAKCDTSSHTCVKCEANADCAHIADKPYCDPLAGACVACLSNANCNDPGASHCDETIHECTACANNTDCLHILDGADNLPLCLEAKCVECTRTEKGECGTSGVCNALTNRCAEGVTINTASLCEPCVSDEQCVPGQRCIQTTFNPGTGPQPEGWFCHWVQGGGGGAPLTCSGARPFVSERLTSSIDNGAEALMCAQRLATCGAYKAYLSSCGRYDTGMGVIHVDDFADPDLPDDVEGKIEIAAQITADDTVCGMGGRCVTLNSTNGAYRCSHACVVDQDCEVGSCTGSPKACSVN